MDEIVPFSVKLAEVFPSLAETFEVGKAGSSLEEIEEINRFVSLPSEYLDAIRKYDLGRTTWGSIRLFPRFGPRVDSGLAARLKFTNQDQSNPLREYLENCKAIEIGAREMDPIAIITDEGTFSPGNVILIQIGLGPQPVAHCLASGFEQFLLALSNLMDVAFVEGSLESDEFQRRLSALGVLPDQEALWLKIARQDFL